MAEPLTGLTWATAGSLASHQHSSWEHAPELIVVGVGFLAFMGYLRQGTSAADGEVSGGRKPDGWRWLTASLLVIAGLGHIPLIPQHLAEAPYMGILFGLYAVAAVALAVAVFRKRSVIEYAAAGIFGLVGVGAYVTTRLIALRDLHDDVGAWLEPLGVMCVVTELTVAVIAAIQVHRYSASSATRQAGKVDALKVH